ncbi:MAG: restriction endonuclease, partial [Candidatus Kariarchaeaceae archaeon]
MIENSSRGIWALTKTEDAPIEVDPHEVIKTVRAKIVEEKSKKKSVKPDGTESEEILSEIDDWKEQLSSLLLSLTPAQFERLTQIILRESGFTQVEVTGRSGVGG